MYKASYTAGEKWFEYLKSRPAFYMCYRVNGDGSTTMLETPATKGKARKWVQFMNDNYATEGGRYKVANSTDAADFLTKKTAAKYRLEYLRLLIEREQISYGEIAELQSLAKYITADDVQLLEWAGIPENA